MKASGGSLIEVRMPDGQIAQVEVPQRRADAMPRRRVGRALQAIGQAVTQSFTVQEPSHMPVRACVPVRVTTVRRIRQ